MDVAALIRSLRSSDSATAGHAMAELYRLATFTPGGSPAVLRAIRTAGGIPVLVRHVRNAGEPALQEAAVAVLANVAMQPQGAGAITAVPQAIPALVQLLLPSGCSSAGAKRAAAVALRNVSAAGGPQHSAAIAAAGAIPALVRLLQPKGGRTASSGSLGSTSGASTNTPDSIGSAAARNDLAAAAAHALGHLAIGSPDNITAIGAAGAIPPLVQCLHSTDAELQHAAAAALFSATANCPQNKAAVAAAGGVPNLVQMLQAGSTAAQEQAAGALGNISSGGAAMQAAVVEAGGVPALTRLLHSTVPAAVQGRAARALRSLLDDCPRACQAAAAAGAAPLLAQLLASGSGGELLEGASGTLAHMTYSHRASRAAVEAEDCLPVLVRLGMPASGRRGGARQQSAAAVLQLLSLSHELEQGDASLTGGGGAAAAAGRQVAGSSSAAAPAASAGAEAEGSHLGLRTKPAQVCAAPGCGATSGLKRCGACGTARYCSERCCRAHWRVHKIECRRLQAAPGAQ